MKRTATAVVILSVVLVGAMLCHALSKAGGDSRQEGALKNGFYYQKHSAAPARVVPQDKLTGDLGSRLQLDIESAEVFSVRNDNSEFHALIRLTKATQIDESRTRALVVNGTTYRETAAGRILYFRIFGEANAREVAEFLNPRFVRRSYTPHHLQVFLTPKNSIFSATNSVEVVVEFRNMGTQAVTFRRHGSLLPDSFFASDLGEYKDYTVVSIRQRPFGNGHTRTATLKPGESETIAQDLSKWFAFTNPGRYLVTLVVDVSYVHPEHRGRDAWKESLAARATICIGGKPNKMPRHVP